MSLNYKEIVDFLKGKTFISLNKTKEGVFTEWTGEIDDFYIIIRYANNTTAIGIADNILEAISNLHLTVTGKLNNIKELSEILKFHLPANYEEY